MQYSFWSIPKHLPAQNILEPVEGQGINFELFSFTMSIESFLTPFLKTKSQKSDYTTYNSRIRQNVIILHYLY